MAVAFIPDKETVQDQWNKFLHQPQYVSAQYLQFKNKGFGSTPIESYNNLMMPTPHISQPMYSEIETTKRKAKEFDRTRFQKKGRGLSLASVDIGEGFTYPDNHWNKFTPSPSKFRRFPVFKDPFGKMPPRF